GKKAEALAWLQKAVTRGYGLVEIQRDPDFAALRGEPEFGKLALAAPAAPTASPSTPSTRAKRYERTLPLHPRLRSPSRRIDRDNAGLYPAGPEHAAAQGQGPSVPGAGHHRY